ncbi:MAG: hypothetical protein LBL31_06915, partial [Spirochaetaceae bacterium]|nr:hypothetical protein [Spirochaetaceae bacterium]
ISGNAADCTYEDGNPNNKYGLGGGVYLEEGSLTMNGSSTRISGNTASASQNVYESLLTDVTGGSGPGAAIFVGRGYNPAGAPIDDWSGVSVKASTTVTTNDPVTGE